MKGNLKGEIQGPSRPEGSQFCGSKLRVDVQDQTDRRDLRCEFEIEKKASSMPLKLRSGLHNNE